jgi:hypothetical protein
VDGELLFLDEQAEHERFKLGEGIPVDAAEVVALHVGTEVGEFHGGAVGGGASHAAGVAAKKLPRDKREHF